MKEATKNAGKLMVSIVGRREAKKWWTRCEVMSGKVEDSNLRVSRHEREREGNARNTKTGSGLSAVKPPRRLRRGGEAEQIKEQPELLGAINGG
jgi:hypothetical protein